MNYYDDKPSSNKFKVFHKVRPKFVSLINIESEKRKEKRN